VVRIEKRILSPTAINTYMSCPRKFYLRYVKRLKTRPSIHLIRGLIVHQTLHQFNKNHPKNVLDILLEKVCRELLGVFNEKWKTAENSLKALDLPEEQIEFFRHDSELMLINFARWLLKNSLPTADLAETKIWSNNLRIMGIIDAVHIMGDKVVLVDYKTSKYARITEDIKRQAALYALMYQDKYNKAPDEVWIHFLKVQDDPLPVHIDEHTLQYGKILIDSVHENTVSKMEEDYPCKCGGYCERDFVTN
jgi:CRISPR/Cas system-associated exonuclease Cas4 (RecB family)